MLAEKAHAKSSVLVPDANNEDTVLRKRKKKVYCFASKGEAQRTPVPEAVILPSAGTGGFYRGDL